MELGGFFCAEKTWGQCNHWEQKNLGSTKKSIVLMEIFPNLSLLGEGTEAFLRSKVNHSLCSGCVSVVVCWHPEMEVDRHKQHGRKHSKQS